MSRYYRDQYGNLGETTSTELPNSVQELTEEEYNEAIAALVAEDEARAAEEAEARAERQAREEAERQQRERERQEAERQKRERERQEAEARAERERIVYVYYLKVKCGDMSISGVPQEYQEEVEERINTSELKSIEERVETLENPAPVKFSTMKHITANTWVSALSESLEIGNYQVVTTADSFKALCKGVVISTTNPIFMEDSGVLSIQVSAEITGDYLVKLYKI